MLQTRKFNTKHSSGWCGGFRLHRPNEHTTHLNETCEASHIIFPHISLLILCRVYKGDMERSLVYNKLCFDGHPVEEFGKSITFRKEQVNVRETKRHRVDMLVRAHLHI